MNIVKALALIGFFGCAPLRAATPDWEWVQTVAGGGNDRGTGVAIDGSGNLYFSGVCGTTTIGTNQVSGDNMFWAKVSPETGAFIKVKTGSSGPSYTSGLAIATNGDLISSGMVWGFLGLETPMYYGNQYAQSELTFLVRFNGQLEKLWGSIFAINSSWMPASPMIAPDGTVLVATSATQASYTGNTLSGFSAPSGGATVDSMTLKVSSTGQFQWIKRGGGASTDMPAAMDVDRDGTIYVGGFCDAGAFSFGTIVTNTSGGGTSGFLAKYSSAGDVLALRLFESAGNDAVTAIRVTTNRDIIIGGTLDASANAWPVGVYKQSGQFKGFLSRMRIDGTTLWTRQLGTLQPTDIREDAAGNIIVAGTMIGSTTINGNVFNSKGDTDAFIGQFTSSGSLTWGTNCGGLYADTAGQIAISPNNVLYITATVTDGGFVGPFFVEGRGQSDAVLAKLRLASSQVIPAFTTQPQSVVVSGGMNIELNAAAVGDPPLTYQWWFNGAPLTGQTSPSLVISNAGATNAGSYFVVAHNGAGDTPSEIANVSYTDAGSLQLSVHPSLTIFGTPGRTYRIDYAVETRSPAVWTTITNISLPATPYVWQDTNAAITDKRFYRVLLQP